MLVKRVRLTILYFSPNDGSVYGFFKQYTGNAVLIQVLNSIDMINAEENLFLNFFFFHHNKRKEIRCQVEIFHVHKIFLFEQTKHEQTDL